MATEMFLLNGVSNSTRAPLVDVFNYYQEVIRAVAISTHNYIHNYFHFIIIYIIILISFCSPESAETIIW